MLVHRKHIWQLAGDATVSMVLVLGHALVLMCEGMAFSVAMNSKRAPALIALVIASNFGEIKGASPFHPLPWLLAWICHPQQEPLPAA